MMAAASGYAGLLVVDLHFPASQSLKDKRSPLRSVMTRLRAAGYSASEVGMHDKWQRAHVAISIVSGGAGECERLLDEALRMCERPDVEASTVQRTVLSLDDMG
jgi:uncharacterized protein YlxP (DUF503 family)